MKDAVQDAVVGVQNKDIVTTNGYYNLTFDFAKLGPILPQIITAWRDANDTAKGRNACVIDCSKTPHQFWFWDESSGSPVWTKKEKGAVSW